MSFSSYLKLIFCKNRVSTQFSTTFDSLFKVSEMCPSSNDAAFLRLDFISFTLGLSFVTCFSIKAIYPSTSSEIFSGVPIAIAVFLKSFKICAILIWALLKSV